MASDPAEAPASVPVLRKQLARVRRHHVGWIALAGATAANAALALALVPSAPRTAFPHITVVAPPPAPAPVYQPHFHFAAAPAAAPASAPAALPDPFVDRGPCPAPYAAAPKGQPRLPIGSGALVGFAAAPTDSRWLAVWSRDRLFVSHDGGVAWSRVLDGTGRIIDASFDCHGRALVLRDGAGLGVRDDTREVWRPVPVQMYAVAESAAASEGADGPAAEDAALRYRAHLFGGGRSIAVVGAGEVSDGNSAMVAVSDDVGASWRSSDLGYWEGETPYGGWRGDTLHLAMAWHDCMSEGTFVIAVSPTRTRVDDRGEYASAYAMVGTTVIGDGYECGGETGDRGVCALGPGGWRPLLDPVALGETQVELVDGPVAVAIVGDRVHRVRTTGLGRGRPWPRGAQVLGTDRAGRLWGLDDTGALIRR